MKYKITRLNGIRFLECKKNGGVIDDENAALDLVALCGENEVNTLLLYTENLVPDFFDLKTGIAGRILLKFSNYSIKVATVIPPEVANHGRFYEMVLETNRGNEFRVFSNHADALQWILKIN